MSDPAPAADASADAPAAVSPDGFHYRAFLSYSHADNREPGRHWADWLHQALETFPVPPNLAGRAGRDGETIPARLFPVFQDGKELPTSASLGHMIEDALNRSAYLIVLCSPRSARSRWVNEEILQYKRLGRSHRILPLILSGEPNASESEKPDRAELECFPEALRYGLGADGQPDRAIRSEPIAADIRLEDRAEADTENIEHAPILDREKLRLIAGLLGVGFDELVQRDKQRQVLEARRHEQEKRDEAARLVQAARANARGLIGLPRGYDPQVVFAKLGEAEDQLLRASLLDPENRDAPVFLRQARGVLVRASIDGGDLNMATLFLERLKSLGDPDAPEARRLYDDLEEAWKISDPKRNPKLESMLRWALASPVLTALWILAAVILGASTYAQQDWDGAAEGLRSVRHSNWLLRPAGGGWNVYAGVLATVGLLPQLVLLGFALRAKLGRESSWANTFAAAYACIFLSLFTANVPALVCSLRVLLIAYNPEIGQVVWPAERLPLDAAPAPAGA